MTDLCELEMLIFPEQVNAIHTLLIQTLPILPLVECIKEYLIPRLEMTYNYASQKIEFSIALTFTVCNWKIGPNCGTKGIKCIYPHTKDVFCGIFYPDKISNLVAYGRGMNILNRLIKQKFPSLFVNNFSSDITALIDIDLSSFMHSIITDRIITSSSLGINFNFIQPKWEICVIHTKDIPKTVSS